MNIQRDLWLCSDCTNAAVNDDYTGLDYYYSPKVADRRMTEIQEGLRSLGPGLVPDFLSEEVELECSDCGHVGYQNTFKYLKDEYDEEVPVCLCGSFEVREREHGFEEFSRDDCDCCDTSLAGERFRFAVLTDSDVIEPSQNLNMENTNE